MLRDHGLPHDNAFARLKQNDFCQDKVSEKSATAADYTTPGENIKLNLWPRTSHGAIHEYNLLLNNLWYRRPSYSSNVVSRTLFIGVAVFSDKASRNAVMRVLGLSL
jgi:hypothetical protein